MRCEAALVDLLACGVAAGLARQDQERQMLKLEQFFGPDLASRLVRDKTLLEGREARVTLLFCDVRGFSRVSEKLGPAGSLRWMNDVMTELSGRVLDEAGVLVDYVGDEVMAMWGAPEDQPDQAERAVRAALAMLGALPAVNARWQASLGTETRIGIGVNTGPAQVGNTGSTFKFKYGPLGNTVNLGSRVQGLTKYLQRSLLVTRATREQLGDDFIARRVVRVRVVNIAAPVDLYEVESAGLEMRRQFFAESEAASRSWRAPTSPWPPAEPASCSWSIPTTARSSCCCPGPARPSCKATASSTRCGSRRGSEPRPAGAATVRERFLSKPLPRRSRLRPRSCGSLRHLLSMRMTPSQLSGGPLGCSRM